MSKIPSKLPKLTPVGSTQSTVLKENVSKVQLRPKLVANKGLPLRKSISAQHRARNSAVGLKKTRKSLKRPLTTLPNGPPQQKIARSGVPAIKAPLLKRTDVPKTGTSNSTTTAASKTEAQKPKVMKPAPYDFKARYNLLLEKHKELKEKCNNAESKLSEVESVFENLHTAESKIVVLEENLSSTSEKLENSTKQAKNFKQNLDKTEKELTILTNEHQNLQTRFSSMETENQDLLSKVKNSTQEYDTLKQTFEQTQSKLSGLTEEHQNLRTQFATNQIKCEELMCKLERVEKNYKESSAENARMKVEIADSIERICKSEVQRKVLHNVIQDLKGNIRVFCRIRPTIAGESDKALCSIAVLDDCSLKLKKNVDSLQDKRLENAKCDFSFDRIFDATATQQYVFEEVSHLVQSALDGYNVCVFAYGQTGSGKTYTMQGASDGDGQSVGIIPRTVDLIFAKIPDMHKLGWRFTIKATFLEVYNERIRDLLVPNDKADHDIRMSETNAKDVYVTNTEVVAIGCADELKRWIDKSQRNRAVAVTDFNEHSSRSHSITKIMIEARNAVTHETCYSSINLVDLAGSEKANTENLSRLAETKNINRSLSSLTSVILGLVQKNDHIPYRNSKLTYLLMPCLGGNSKTLMLVNISSLDECWAESIHSLRFASQVKSVKMAPLRKNRIATTNGN